jgi:hypothetical protein
MASSSSDAASQLLSDEEEDQAIIYLLVGALIPPCIFLTRCYLSSTEEGRRNVAACIGWLRRHPTLRKLLPAKRAPTVEIADRLPLFGGVEEETPAPAPAQPTRTRPATDRMRAAEDGADEPTWLRAASVILSDSGETAAPTPAPAAVAGVMKCPPLPQLAVPPISIKLKGLELPSAPTASKPSATPALELHPAPPIPPPQMRPNNSSALAWLASVAPQGVDERGLRSSDVCENVSEAVGSFGTAAPPPATSPHGVESQEVVARMSTQMD